MKLHLSLISDNKFIINICWSSTAKWIDFHLIFLLIKYKFVETVYTCGSKSTGQRLNIADTDLLNVFSARALNSVRNAGWAFAFVVKIPHTYIAIARDLIPRVYYNSYTRPVAR